MDLRLEKFALTSDKSRFYINGMTCTACQSRIENALNKLDGIKSAKVSFRTGTAEIIYNPSIISTKQINSVIRELGYSVSQKKASSSFLRTAYFLGVILVLFVLLDHFNILNVLVPSQLADSTMGYGMLFVIGFITSVHCIAMCGGINLSQCLPHGNPDDGNCSRLKTLFPALLYNLGRIISYTVIGFILGFVGMLLGSGSDTGMSALLQGILKIIAGVFMIVMGLRMLNLFPALRRFSIRLPNFLNGKIGNAKKNTKQPFLVGLLNGLMPCGPLQSMQIVALASGNPLIGALSMLLFSLGTVPLMLGFGSLVSLLGRKFARTVTTIGAVLVVVLGLAMLSQGGALSGLISSSSLLALSIALSIIGIVSILPYQKAVQRTICVALAVCICTAVFAVFSVCRLHVDSVKTNGSTNTAIIDGVQVVCSTLEPGAYPDITIQSGLPVKWLIHAPEGSINGCNYKLLIREYGIEYSFKTGENIIEFTPDKIGEFSYSCWMGMIHGSICVTAAADDMTTESLSENAVSEQEPVGSCCDVDSLSNGNEAYDTDIFCCESDSENCGMLCCD